jgi:hypothetical protein
MTLTEIEALAERATPDTQWDRHMLGNQGETIKAMCQLIRQLAEAVDIANDYAKEYDEVPFATGERAFKAYEEFNK